MIAGMRADTLLAAIAYTFCGSEHLRPKVKFASIRPKRPDRGDPLCTTHMGGGELGVLHSAKRVYRYRRLRDHRFRALPSEWLRIRVPGREVDWRERGEIGTDSRGMMQLVRVMTGNAHPTMAGQGPMAKRPGDVRG